jgi:hypothetical protein
VLLPVSLKLQVQPLKQPIKHQPAPQSLATSNFQEIMKQQLSSAGKVFNLTQTLLMVLLLAAWSVDACCSTSGTRDAGEQCSESSGDIVAGLR